MEIAGKAGGSISLLCHQGSEAAISLESSPDLAGWTTSFGLLTGDSAISVLTPFSTKGFFRIRPLTTTGSYRRVAVGSGGVILDLPPSEHGPEKNPYDSSLQVPTFPKLADGVTGPVPTCSWWSSAVWDFGPGKPYGYPLFAWPLAFVPSATGISCGVPSLKTVSTYGYQYQFIYGAAGELPLRVSPAGMTSPDLKVTGWGDWTVGLRMTQGSTSLDAQIGMGLPMAWFSCAGAALQVTPSTGADHVVQEWRRAANELGLRIFGVYYLLIGPAGSTWSPAYPFTTSIAGPVTVAVLPDTNPATLDRFRGCSAPQDSRISWSYDDATATLTTRYDLIMTPSAKAPPMALFPHQWTLTTAAATDAYDSPCGRMRLVDGGTFSTTMKFPGLLPNLPMPVADADFDTVQLNAYLVEIAGESIPNGADTYAVGKALGKLASVVPIARQAGRDDLADAWLARIKTALNDWFDGESPNLFRYDRTWSTLYGFPAGFETNGYIQDHHLHWGYFIQAAALVAREDPAWAQQYGPMVELLIRDTANWNRGDATFPFLNSFDPYAGHAWSSGPAAFGSGNNEESSSESVNFDAGVFQWGLATGNRTIRDLGIFLYATDIEAIHRYWFNDGGLAFPSGFNWPMVGIVWGNGGTYATFFGGYPDHTAYIHGINFLPITPASLHLGRDHDHFLSTLSPFATDPAEWFDVIDAARATADATDAAARLKANPGYAVEGGSTHANTYHWIHSLRQLGYPVATGVTADNPSAVVFAGTGKKTYVVWNPGTQSLQTSFSDGTTITQDARSLKTVTFSPGN